jgi:hypothetical protein
MRIYNTHWNGTATILSLHIPKAMGSWLRKEIVHALGPERNFKPIATLVNIPKFDDPIWDSIEANGTEMFSLIEGHFTFNETARNLTNDCFRISSIRDPRNMLLSLINYIVQTRESDDKLRSCTLEEGYIFDNPICRFFSGISPQRMLSDSELPALIAISIENIINHFDFVFIDKHIEPCCIFFNELTNLMVDSKQVVNASHESKWFFSTKIFNEIAHNTFNHLFKGDIVLYDKIVDLFVDKASEEVKGLLPGLTSTEYFKINEPYYS